MEPIELAVRAEELHKLFSEAKREPQEARWWLSHKYMPWYLAARELVKARAPDQLHDFEQYYLGAEGRQVVTRDTYGIKDYFDGRMWRGSQPHQELASAFISFDRQWATVYAVCLLPDPTDTHTGATPTPLEQVMLRFHEFVVALRDRPRCREGIEVQDEYDVQYLLEALLKLFFDDVRPEERTRSKAGSSNSIDFMLDEHGVAIEVKLASKSHKDKKIGEELAIDVQHYKGACHTLYCLIYDPDSQIKNRGGLLRDLGGFSTPELKVLPYISPLGYPPQK